MKDTKISVGSLRLSHDNAKVLSLEIRAPPRGFHSTCVSSSTSFQREALLDPTGTVGPTVVVEALVPTHPQWSHKGSSCPKHSRVLTLECDARIVDQHIQAPVLLAQEVLQDLDALEVIGVQQVEAGTQSLGLELLHGRLAPHPVPRREHQVP